MNHSPDSTTMVAAVLDSAHAPLRLAQIARPAARPGHVLVEVSAVGLNPLDVKIRSGKAAHAQHPLPCVLGIDMAGVVVAVGAGVTGFAQGDRVFGMTGGVGGVQGALAQYVAADASLLARQPEAFSMREAAATPLAFITAWEGLVDRANVGPSMRVLIHGGAGGVGHVAVQIAKARGANVYAAGDVMQQPFVESLGATFIDYRTRTVEEYVATHTDGEGFDIIFDTVGGATLDASFEAVRRYRGRVVSALGWGTHSLAPLSMRGATYSGVFTLLPLLSGRHRDHHGRILREAAAMADAKRLELRVDPQEFTLEKAEDAYRYLESGGACGKVVVTVA
jgi:NADPH:quinone reductase-like Zn-dependent oxidoreductase